MGTYRQIFYQIVFGTRDRKTTITNAFETELYKYTYGIIKNHNCKLYRINGMEDHIHIMSDLHPPVCLSYEGKRKFPAFEGWQEGYGAFTYSVKEKDTGFTGGYSN